MEEGLTFNQDVLVMIAGSVLSALFTYVPKFNVWFAMKTDEFKQYTMIGIMFVVSGGMFALACFGLLEINEFVCNKGTAWHFIYTFILAVMSNQSTYLISPKPLAVKQANDVIQEDELYQKDKLGA